MLRAFITAFLFALTLGSSPLSAAEPGKISGHQTRTIEGWTVHINDRLLEQDGAATKRAVELLTAQLQEIKRVVSAPALKELLLVTLWMSPEYANVKPRAEYHPDAKWLRENGRDPAMVRCIEFTNVSIFERETKRMPNFALHELAHAFHHRVLEKGFNNPDLKAAYEKTKAAGLYDRVERRFGDGRTSEERAYAMTTPQEYFAESTEAFFSTNDFFPFERSQLKRHDPEMFALLGRLWGQTAEAQ